MKRLVPGLVLILALIAIILIVQPSFSQANPGSALILSNPVVCPSSGCAAGQRLNIQSSFDLGSFEPGTTPNVQFCVYTPVAWSASQFRVDPRGGVTNSVYTPSITYCTETAPANYTLLGGAYASLASSTFGDSLGFAFRIGDTAIASGSVLMRVMEQSSGNWTRTQQSFLAVPVVPTAATVFVANDSATCSINSPCYINSGDDLSSGLGTALKDAIDARAGNPQGSIVLLGNYAIKSQTVLVDEPVTISGLNDASLTYYGQVCSQPMLRITAGATLRSLNINDGSCATPGRDLVAVDSATNVTIESNDLVSGANAITATDNAGNLLLRFNQIRNNTGYAVQLAAGSSTGRLEALANNFYGNRSGAQVECNQKGRVDHNFWGGDNVAASNCTFTNGKRLGAAVQLRPTAPGVQAGEFLVASALSSAFDGQISYQHAADGTDFSLYILNHGYTSPDSIPFTSGSSALTACSNYWDVFLPDGTAPNSTLGLYFKYNLNSGCTATIESTAYCGQTDQALLPLYWYDPAANLTNGWSTTGKSLGGNAGQDTVCLPDSDEIRVSIDSTGRPNLADDLRFLPFVVGVPLQNSAIMLTNFTNQSSDSQILLNWTTSSEYNVQSFYVQRDLVGGSGFQRISNAIASQGTPQTGASYSYLDTGLANGTTYRYRLEIITINQQSIFSGELLATAGVPTPTPTPTSTTTATGTITTTTTITLTPTITRTITPTRTPTRTRTPIQSVPTWTRTPRPSTFRTNTPVPTRTANSLTRTAIARTSAAGGTQSTPPGTAYPGPETNPTQSANPTSQYPYPGEIDLTGTVTLDETNATVGTTTSTPRSFRTSTPTETVTPEAEAESGSSPRGPWLPLLIILSGLSAVVGVLWYLWSRGIVQLPFLPGNKNNDNLDSQESGPNNPPPDGPE
ncbi:MAG TPA: hypothetical protein VN452_00025 [Longilinea sp.]|nr:hypothetical protein [Longilinea sp.]